MSKPPVRPEDVEQASGVRLLKLCGFAVGVTSQGYRKERGGTRITPGIPDVLAMHPNAPGGIIFWEAKREGGAVRPSQLAFAETAARCGVTVIRGTYADLELALHTLGFMAGGLVVARHRAAWPDPVRMAPWPLPVSGGRGGPPGRRGRPRRPRGA